MGPGRAAEGVDAGFGASFEAAWPSAVPVLGGLSRLVGRRRSPRLSVVVPVYDVEDYLAACLDSLAAQTVGTLEVVIVDDGSTDGSARDR